MRDELGIQDEIQKATEGDQAALAALFEAHRHRLSRMVELRMDRRVQGRVAASDVLQEAYLDLARQISNYGRAAKLPFYLWMRRITGQRLAMVHRQQLGTKMRDANLEVSLYRGRMPEASSVCLASQLVGDFTTASKQAIRHETQLRLEATIEQLTESDREIIALRHFEQMSNQEVAMLLEITEQAASNRYFRALRKIRDAMTKHQR